MLGRTLNIPGRLFSSEGFSGALIFSSKSLRLTSSSLLTKQRAIIPVVQCSWTRYRNFSTSSSLHDRSIANVPFGCLANQRQCQRRDLTTCRQTRTTSKSARPMRPRLRPLRGSEDQVDETDFRLLITAMLTKIRPVNASGTPPSGTLEPPLRTRLAATVSRLPAVWMPA